MPSPLQKGLRLDQFENKKVGKTRNVDELRVDGNASRLGKDEKTKKLRESIGLGYSLILDEAGRQICIYNRGNLPLFVSSAYLIFQYRAEGEEVVKVKPGYSIKAFDLDFRPPGGFTSVPSSPCSSIYVSFGKGWGPGYKRKEVLGCNCWMEICLNKFTQKQSRWFFLVCITFWCSSDYCSGPFSLNSRDLCSVFVRIFRPLKWTGWICIFFPCLGAVKMYVDFV